MVIATIIIINFVTLFISSNYHHYLNEDRSSTAEGSAILKETNLSGSLRRPDRAKCRSLCSQEWFGAKCPVLRVYEFARQNYIKSFRVFSQSNGVSTQLCPLIDVVDFPDALKSWICPSNYAAKVLAGTSCTACSLSLVLFYFRGPLCNKKDWNECSLALIDCLTSCFYLED